MLWQLSRAGAAGWLANFIDARNQGLNLVGMNPPKFLVPAVLLVACAIPVEAGIVFGPVKGKPGESVRLVTFSETPGGTIQRKVGEKASSGTISITRERELVWTFRDPAADGTRRGMVKVPKLTTATRVKIDGKEEKNEDSSPLTGKMFAMSKAPGGEWKFELDGSVPMARVQQEIDELKVYLKRDWFPARSVEVGDSWEFDPAWVKLVIQKDLSSAQTIGTMRLRQVRHMEQRDVAVIDVSIESTGANFKADGSEAAATVDLKGQVTVNLATMLDEQLELQGTVTTRARKAGESTEVKLPVKLRATKSFVRDR